MKLFSVSFVLAVFLCMTSCQVEEPEGDPIVLLAGDSSVAWRVASGKVKVDGAEIDVVGAQNPCVLDNQVVLFADGRFELNEGATMCQTGDPSLIYSGKWNYSATNRSLTIDRFTFLSIVIDQPTFVISSINADSFTGTTSVTFQGQKVDAEISFSRIK